MQNRDDVDGSQRPVTADAPDLSTAAGHLGRGGDPVEGRDPATQPAEAAGGGGPSVADHLGPAGDPVEGDPDAIEHDLQQAQNTPAKE